MNEYNMILIFSKEDYDWKRSSMSRDT